MTNRRELADRLETMTLHGYSEAENKALTEAARLLREPVAGEVEDAVAELKRLREATWTGLSDAELGRCFKAFAQQVEETSQKSWSGDAEMRLGLMNMGLQQAIKMAAESNAETFTYTAKGFRSEGRALGNWTVTIARFDDEGKG